MDDLRNGSTERRRPEARRGPDELTRYRANLLVRSEVAAGLDARPTRERQQTVHNQSDIPAAGWQMLETADGPMRVYTARPLADPQGAVVVLQEAFGVNGHIQDVTRRLATAGYLAVAPDLFYRHEIGEVAYSDRETAMSRIAALGVEEIGMDVGAVLGNLSEVEGVPHGRTAVVGFCFGGRAAFTVATLIPGLAGSVVFYGPGIAEGPHAVLERVDGIDARVLMLVGDQDPTIPADHLDAIRAACDKVGADLSVELFPGAGHAFHCDARPEAFHAESAGRAWERTLEFLSATVRADRA